MKIDRVILFSTLVLSVMAALLEIPPTRQSLLTAVWIAWLAALFEWWREPRRPAARATIIKGQLTRIEITGGGNGYAHGVPDFTRLLTGSHYPMPDTFLRETINGKDLIRMLHPPREDALIAAYEAKHRKDTGIAAALVRVLSGQVAAEEVFLPLGTWVRGPQEIEVCLKDGTRLFLDIRIIPDV